MKKLILILLAVISLPVFSQNVMTPELLWDLSRLSGISVSPDGKWVVFGVTTYNLEENKGNRNLFIMSAGGGEPRQLTSLPGSEFDEIWRPDGKKIGFLATVDGAPQLYEINPDGTGLEKASDVEGGIANFSYSPDMEHVFFTRDIKLDSTVNDIYPDLPQANARIIDDLMYRHWDEWHDYHYTHLFYAPYENGKIGDNMVDVIGNERFDAPVKPLGGRDEMAWSPDGKAIAYTTKRLTGADYAVSTNSDVFIYDIATKTTINISEGMKGYDRNPVFSPDGSKLAWNSMEREGYESDRNKIMIHDFNTKTTYELTEGLDRNAGHFEWSEDGSKMYFLSGEQATAQLYEINLKDKKLRQITSGDHDYVDFALAGNRIIGGRMSMSQPVELFSINPKNGKTEQLTRINEDKLNSLELGRVEKRWIKTTDNKDMLTWVIYPPDFDPAKKYPTLLYCQGGPQSTVSQFFSYRWNFQLMAANGYIVVAPNRRGLPSFGQEWNEQISGDWGGQAMEDYLSAIDAVKQEPYVDEERLGAVGASFGGYSVYWLAGDHDNRFKALIAHCGLFNLTSWYGTTEELFFANWDIGGPYWEDELQDEYERFSPHTYVENWTAPILVIHGEKDFRVPVSEGIQAFHAAQIRNVPSRFLYFPEEGHWVLSPQNGVLWHRVFFDWLDQWLK